ncbi:hypothetical protein [Tenacibaculum sp. Bg11-29]|uniref:hypothetical protein n=1 Tax=Tenacibaculum sp. Bg11-29 TaxID=2058306 RepID=UPI0012FECAEE|nr:hypothetical protein [Tenacibaculum sp. Bg11-29]
MRNILLIIISLFMIFSCKNHKQNNQYLIKNKSSASEVIKKNDFKLTAKEENKLINDIVKSINLKDSSVPKGPKSDASKLELYKLAWEQFIALNWPVANTNTSGNRAKPNASSDSTFLSVTPNKLPTTVWSTYASKAEVFNHQSSNLPAWNLLKKPVYQYTYQPSSLKESDEFNLFNNLDENNEIGEAVVFGGAGKGNISGGDQILYEAKINETEYSYLRAYNLQNADTASNWAKNTVKKLNAFGGTCLSEEAAKQEVICFPCADENNEGAIEIKAAWRKLNDSDKKERYYIQKVLVYKKVGDKVKYTNQDYGLVGLHIIRKTKNFPTFIFTTFNHVDNLDSGIYYNNSIALEEAKGPYYQYYKNKTENGKTKQVPDLTYDTNNQYIKTGNIAVKTQEEIHKIPSGLELFNTAIQKQIKKQSKNNNSVWQYYELLGVQAVPVDLKDADSDDSYYLANNVIETDYTLRRFTGAFANKTGILLHFSNVNKKGKKVSMGGCMGCHGNAQAGGNDFSFLLGDGPIKMPDTLGVPPDVKAIKKILKMN